MISRFFIERPVLANVLALVFVLIGMVALFQLPSAQYPNVVPPTIQVTTTYPGASAKTAAMHTRLPQWVTSGGLGPTLRRQVDPRQRTPPDHFLPPALQDRGVVPRLDSLLAQVA
jgi:hypothetical protein